MGERDVAADVLAEISERLGGMLAGLRQTALRRLTASVPVERVKAVLRASRDDLGCRHLSAMSGVDSGPTLGVVYHLSARGGFVLSIRTAVPRDAPRMPTVTDIFPGANMYEREIHDLFGITFEGHPDPRRMLLTEEWPADVYPLRKDFKSDSTKRPTGPTQGGGTDG
jgi:NADH-quinone oxidoreductase subunit C